MSDHKLNPAQKQAVEYTDGPLIIVAGAGTGKTTVITEKICYLIKNKMAKPEEILALTFTDKSAAEMAERVDGMIEIGYLDLQISTFHAFCQKLLEHHAIDIGLSNQFKLLTETDAWMLVRKNLDKFNLDYYRALGNPSKHIHELISHFSKCKDELISPQQYLDYAENLKMDKDDMNTEEKNRLSEIANAYHTYNQLLLDNNALDFGDLIYYAHKLLTQRPLILESLRKRFRYILIDEFQDVDWAQYQLVQMLAGDSARGLTVVGDDDQSIYAFRGASVSNILRFKDDFSQAKEIVLNENYRSNQEILDYAYKLIQNNNPDRLEAKLKIDKKLKSNLKSSEKSVVHISCSTLDDEVKAVVKEISKLKKTDKDVVWDDFAILIRANNHSEPFISALEKAGIPYEFLAASGLYRQPVILDAINFLKLLENYHESTAIYRILCLPFLHFDEHDMQKISRQAKQKGISYYEALKRAQEFEVSKDGITICDKILNLINVGLQKVHYEKPTTILLEFLEQSGYLKYIVGEENSGNQEVIRQAYQLKEFFDDIASYESVTPGANTSNYLEHLNYILESGDRGAMHQLSDTPDSVNIITVHKAKGLEFKYVFVVNLVEDRFPARKYGESIEIPAELIKEQLPEGDSHWQEERRLFYVAMTRAKNRLYLTGANDYGGIRTKKISRFLDEIGFKSEHVGQGSALLFVERESGTKSHADSAPKSESTQFIYQLPKSFSFSQINTYSNCPYKYKLAQIINIPTKGNASFSFGQTMHSTMQKFYQRIQELNKVEQGSLFNQVETAPKNPKDGKIKVPTLDELIKIYEISWIPDWYKSKTQKDEYYKTGKEILKIFYEAEKDNWTIPIALESRFKIRVGEYLISGRIDRVDQLKNGTLEIIDYKTGAGKEKIEGDDKNQLLIYQMAVEQLSEYKNFGSLNQLTYYYLNDNIKLSFIGTPKELEKLEEKLIKTIDKIHEGDFTATPSQFACQHCDFRDICQYKI